MFSACAREKEGSTFLIIVTGLLSFISTFFTSSNVPPYTDNNQLHNGILSKSRAILIQEGEQRMKNGMKKEEIKRVTYISTARYTIMTEKKRHQL